MEAEQQDGSFDWRNAEDLETLDEALTWCGRRIARDLAERRHAHEATSA